MNFNNKIRHQMQRRRWQKKKKKKATALELHVIKSVVHVNCFKY